MIPVFFGIIFIIYINRPSNEAPHPEAVTLSESQVLTPLKPPPTFQKDRHHFPLANEIHRLFKLGQFQEAIQLIFVEIEKDHPQKAWLKQQLPPLLTSLGWQKLKDGQCNEAIPLFHRSQEYGNEPLALKGLGTCHYLSKDFWTAVQFFDSFLEKNFSYDAMTLQIQSLESIGRFDDMVLLLEKALDQENLTPSQRQDLEKKLELNLVKRNESELQAHLEGQYVNINYRAVDHEDISLWTVDILDQAVENISQILNQSPPPKPIDVFLYPQDNFHKIHYGPKWAQGLFDGKVRIPIPHHLSKSNRTKLARILRHEISHALVNYHQNSQLPIWYQEGLAQILECPEICTDFNFPAKRGKLLSMEAFHKPFIQLSPQEAKIAYIQSKFIVYNLIRWKGKSSLHKLLVQNQQDPLEAIGEQFVDLYRIAQKNWQKGVLWSEP